jgi:predicted Rossmann-fold nucleotide-binding protein
MADAREKLTIMVTGGRKFMDKATLYRILTTLLKRYLGTKIVVIHGGARGADKIASEWVSAASAWPVSERVYLPDWNTLGKFAGPVRNTAMVAAKPDVCVAMPGGRGTADAIAKCHEAGIPVVTSLDEAINLQLP